MMALIPTAWKLGGAVLLVALVVGGYFAWAHHQRALGAAAVEIADAKAVAAQKEKDAALSADLVAQREARIRQLEADARQPRAAIQRAPVTYTCPAIVTKDAADYARNALTVPAK
jgi:hypothetical protein